VRLPVFVIFFGISVGNAGDEPIMDRRIVTV